MRAGKGNKCCSTRELQNHRAGKAAYQAERSNGNVASTRLIGRLHFKAGHWSSCAKGQGANEKPHPMAWAGLL